MRKKIFGIILAFAMVMALAACEDEEETTVTGMITAVDGTVITLAKMDNMNFDFGDFNFEDFAQGDFDPEQFGGQGGFGPGNFAGGDFNPEDFEGMSLPEGMSMPEGMNPPDGMSMPEGMTPPEGMSIPEGMSRPDDGEMPSFDGEDFSRPDMGSFSAEELETQDIDIADAHISIEIDGGKEGGSLADIKVGTFVTVTLNGKGKATLVLISQN